MWGSFVVENFGKLIVEPFFQTAIMVGVATLIATLVGVPLGVFLATSQRGELFSMPTTNKIVGAIVNALRSVPFIILAVAIFPVTRILVGTAIGTPAAIVPLTITAAPFIARLVETHIREVDQGLVEAARAFGASPIQIVWKVLLPEAMPGIVLVLTLALISLIGFSAMVGAVGGGGLGDVALRWGYAQRKTDVMIAIVILLIVANQLLQMLGDYISRRMNKRIPRSSRNNPNSV
jgi:ABC-type metal ion transport system, permease component